MKTQGNKMKIKSKKIRGIRKVNSGKKVQRNSGVARGGLSPNSYRELQGQFELCSLL